MADLKGKVAEVPGGWTDDAEAAAVGIRTVLTQAGARLLDEGHDANRRADVSVELRAHDAWTVRCHTREGLAELTLRVDAQEAPLFLGRCVAALAMDPDLFEKSGGSYTIDELAAEYRFTHPDHT